MGVPAAQTGNDASSARIPCASLRKPEMRAVRQVASHAQNAPCRGRKQKPPLQFYQNFPQGKIDVPFFFFGVCFGGVLGHRGWWYFSFFFFEFRISKQFYVLLNRIFCGRVGGKVFGLGIGIFLKAEHVKNNNSPLPLPFPLIIGIFLTCRSQRS